jgi:hypothetical protein
MATQMQDPPNYSVFYYDAEGKIKKSKRLRECTNDADAIATARTLTDERRLELFDGCRRVIVFPAKEQLS